jgi:putative phosphoesterase
MIVGILSDTHLDRPEGRLERLLTGELRSAGLLVHAGDHTSPTVLDYLEFADPRPYHGVAGNMDAGEVARRLPRCRLFETERVKIGVVHSFGSGAGLEGRVAGMFPEMPDVVVFGHTHRPLVERRGRLLLVNPGSPFHPRHGGPGTVALLEVSDGRAEARVVEVRG